MHSHLAMLWTQSLEARLDCLYIYICVVTQLRYQQVSEVLRYFGNTEIYTMECWRCNWQSADLRGVFFELIHSLS